MANKYTKTQLEEIAKESFSIRQMLIKLGLRECGGNYTTIKNKIKEYNIDISHFHGKQWNKNKKYIDEVSYFKNQDILKPNVKFSSHSLKQRLYMAHLKEERCEICGCGNMWQGKPIQLELHHINGNHSDNRLENLQILCPNCHSQTRNFRNRKHITNQGERLILEYTHVCPTCGKEFKTSNKKNKYCCLECKNGKKTTKQTLNEQQKIEELKKVIDECYNISELGKKINVSKTTARNYLKKLNLLNSFKTKYNYKRKKIGQYDLNGNLIKIWNSITEAETELNIDIKYIRQKTSGGYIWKLIE